MAGEWRECTVDDIRSSQPNALATGPFGSAISSRHFVENGVPVIRGSNLSQDVGTRLIDDGLAFLTAEKAKEFSRSLARRGDLVFTCWGTIDQVGLIDERSRYPEYVVSNKQMKLTPNPQEVSSLFLYYLFASPLMRANILNQGIGSSVPGFNLGQLRSIALTLPPLPEQRAIAHILGTLDDKIELNRRMNETLEAMARALFQSWFVDFDPVRAKAEGRAPGLPKPIADLFPDSFQDSELGQIPKGWAVGTLGEVASINYGSNLPQTEMKESGIPVYGAAGVVGYYSEAMFEEPIVLVTSRGSNSGTVHETDGPAFVTNNSFAVVPIARGIGRHFLRLSLLQADIHSRVTGSAQPQLTIANFSSLLMLLPGRSILEQFNRLADSLWEKWRICRMESCTLAALRDALLPKLISGDLRVKDNELYA